MALSKISSLSLKEMNAALRAGVFSATDVVELAISSHEAKGRALNAYKTWDPAKAREQARVADDAGGWTLPLQGIPVSVKDLYGITGWPTFAGSARRLPAEWEEDGPITAVLRRQMSVVMGKTHTVEFAMGGLGLNMHWGTPRNPWDERVHRVPGGSSAGAGISLWEGSAFLALGTDTAGSVRIPASYTGTVGLKTTAGRWSTDKIVPLSHTFDTAGVLARTVEDVAYAFGVLDPKWGQPQDLEIELAQWSLKNARIGIGGSALWDNCDAGIAEAVRQAVEELRSAGANVREAPLPEASDAIQFLAMGGTTAPELSAFLHNQLPEWLEIINPLIKRRLAAMESMSARELVTRYRHYDSLSKAVKQRFADVDVILCPTVPISPPALSVLENVDEQLRLNRESLRNTCVANHLGLCALTMPVGLDALGMPVGLQLLAPGGREEMLLGIARAVEQAIGNGSKRLVAK